MKRLTYVTDEPWSASSAPAIHVDRVCSGLTTLGWAVDVIQPTSVARQDEPPYRSVLIRLPSVLRAVTFQLAATPILICRFLLDRPAVLYVREGGCLAIPSILARLFRIPVILEVNGCLTLEARQRGHKLERFLLKARILDLVERLNIRLSNRIVVVAPGIRQYLVNLYPEALPRIRVVPNGVDPIVGGVTASSSSTCFCVGYVGTLEAWQGIDYVLDAASLINARRPDVTFLFVGNGGEKERLEERARDLNISDIVEFVGAVPHAEVGSYLSRMNLCINYPLRARGGNASPMKVYEYIAACCPVLSAEVAGLRDEFGGAIAYVEAEDPEALATEIIRFCEDPSALESLRLAAKGASLSVRSWTDVSSEISSICGQTLVSRDSCNSRRG